MNFCGKWRDKNDLAGQVGSYCQQVERAWEVAKKEAKPGARVEMSLIQEEAGKAKISRLKVPTDKAPAGLLWRLFPRLQEEPHHQNMKDFIHSVDFNLRVLSGELVSNQDKQVGAVEKLPAEDAEQLSRRGFLRIDKTSLGNDKQRRVKT